MEKHEREKELTGHTVGEAHCEGCYGGGAPTECDECEGIVHYECTGCVYIEETDDTYCDLALMCEECGWKNYFWEEYK